MVNKYLVYSSLMVILRNSVMRSEYELVSIDECYSSSCYGPLQQMDASMS